MVLGAETSLPRGALGDAQLEAPLLPAWPLRRWFYDTRLYWNECNKLPCDVPITLGERFVYCLLLGFYVQVRPCPHRRSGARAPAPSCR